MKNLTVICIPAVFLLFSCRQEKSSAPAAPGSDELSVQFQSDPGLQLENLRLYPVTADESFIGRHAAAAGFQNLEEAIANPRFRIMEKKPYGRFSDESAVNTLTVQNKTTDPVFLMAGDVVQGGLQDRVIAQDMVVPPRTLTDIPVFCVEQGRWNFQDNGETDEESAERDRRVYAFRGYYHVASSDVRRAAQVSRNQQEVWKKVGEITAAHSASSATGAYAGLEQSDDFTRERDRYLRFFGDKFADAGNVVGIVAVSGDKILGADVFAHPALFKKQYKALLHSYAAHAITNGDKVTLDDARMEDYGKLLQRKFQKAGHGKYTHEGMMVHYSELKD